MLYPIANEPIFRFFVFALQAVEQFGVPKHMIAKAFFVPLFFCGRFGIVCCNPCSDNVVFASLNRSF